MTLHLVQNFSMKTDEGRTGKVKMANPREYDYLYEPYWGPVDANIDWCEKNYQFTSYIAGKNVFHLFWVR